MSKHSCHDHGHIWHEGKRPAHGDPHGPLYVRHRERKKDTKVAVYCQHCPAHRELEAYSKHTAPPLPGPVPKP